MTATDDSVPIFKLIVDLHIFKITVCDLIYSCKVLNLYTNHSVYPVANLTFKEPWPSYSKRSTVSSEIKTKNNKSVLKKFCHRQKFRNDMFDLWVSNKPNNAREVL